MNSQSLLDKIRFEIVASIADEVLMKSEKRTLKALLKELGPDKQTCNVLRSEIYDLANSRIHQDNYAAIVNWIEDLNKVILSFEKGDKIDERIYFSPGEDCLNAILHQIKSASQGIKTCLFTISDDRISNELISKHRTGTHVKIITDNDKLYDKGSDVMRMQDAGIPIKVDNTDNHMHHKFALFDKDTTLTGSYNWTRSAERYNHENIIISNSRVLFQAFNKEFDKLWDELVDYSN